MKLHFFGTVAGARWVCLALPECAPASFDRSTLLYFLYPGFLIPFVHTGAVADGCLPGFESMPDFCWISS